MPSIIISLRNIAPHEWQLFSPAGVPIGCTFRGSKFEALRWGTSFISSWYNWVIHVDEGEPDEEKDRIPR